MGQTLTHGIYLPDEGERNCYNGLAANWSILDGAVGTIAEHTSALAGKAPLVHTHTVSQITDFPVYGTTAGTICEGNDSRLSDARTPVAHTHTKSDVTDLFNSANTWSGENTFTKPCKTLGKKLLTGITDLDDAYYNGEVCTYNPNTLHAPASAYGNVLTINNAVNVPDDIYNSWITQIATATDGSYLGIRNRFNGNAWTSWTSILTESRARPTVTNTYDLGSSSYQWKTLNGINPGALSLPKTDSSITAIATSGFSFDGTSERIPDTVNIFSNGEALMNGWLCARIAEGAGHYIFLNSDDNTGRYGICSSCFSSGIVSTLSFGISVYVPIKAGDKPAIRWAKPNGGSAQLIFYPCFGNV